MKLLISSCRQAARVSILLSLFVSLATQAALFGRNLDGNSVTFEAVYDDVLNITWLADANLAASNTFGVLDASAGGFMAWSTAESFIGAMNAENGGAGYLGVNTWRQSTVSPVGGGSVLNTTLSYDGSSDIGYQISASVDAIYNPSGQSAGFTGAELAYHYYNNLGGIGACSGVANINTYGCASSPSIYGVDDATDTANLALFSNIQNSIYWTGTALTASSAFVFATNDGQSILFPTSITLPVWAVTSGDVAASVVPVPAAVWLFGSALIGLVGIKRKK